ncbi:MAG TPA: cytochrome c biogenesis protein DipZ [Steroidobacteraceae bacterium]|nr:cytochrome c biogenesis protein DipZ [Steroidobacteraceae bacterium]
MLLFLAAYLGGVLTVVSPCILPVLPFVFARADRPFATNGLPLLLSMAATFAVMATLASVVGGWVVAANQYGRVTALILLAVFGLALLFPALADRLSQPFVSLGARISQSVDESRERTRSAVWASLALGVATGLLWAPCAGPVLGLILTGAALRGVSVQTSLLLLSYAMGAATSLMLALLVGGRVFAAMKRSLGVGEWVRRALGVLVLVAVGVIALRLDTGVLTRLSLASTGSLEQGLLGRLSDRPAPAAVARAPQLPAAELPVEGTIPSLDGAVAWLNSPARTPQSLRGKVVLVDFWTYSCINCLRSIPYVRAWAAKYEDQGLVVIGVHTPEFAFERDVRNVRQAVADLEVDYPVAVDSNHAIWRAFANEYWPAHYFIDAQGRIRHHHFGEGDYEESERVIQRLLAESGRQNVSADIASVRATGAQAAADLNDVASPETYVGYERAENFISPGGAVHDRKHVYTFGPQPRLNEWAIAGGWTIRGERATLDASGGRIMYRFHARDLHLVLGPGSQGKPVRFRVTLDGLPPGETRGVDVDGNGDGTVTSQRLYQLIRQKAPIADHRFEIEFLDPGVEVYAFTFG